MPPRPGPGLARARIDVAGGFLPLRGGRQSRRRTHAVCGARIAGPATAGAGIAHTANALRATAPRRRTRPRGVVRIERFIRIERLACFARGRPPKRNEGIVGCPRCRAARRPPFARNGRARFTFGVGLAGGRRPRTVPCLLRIRALPILAHYSSSSMISASEPAPCGIAATPSDSRMRFSISRAISGFSRRNSRALSLPWPIFSPL
ncbi:hypothetical protein Y025_4630 [Burkholderia pseudomallei TSV32]|nr:hypothetical protein Y025_4630 [Burkholderia pseudomallei TSV32]